MSTPSPSDERAAPPGPTRRSFLAGMLGALAAVALIAALFVGGVRQVGDFMASGVTQVQVQDAVSSVIQRERADAFLVTGMLEVMATTRVENTRRFLPGVLDLNLGTSSATVRVPGSIHYGIDLREFVSADVRLLNDSVVEVRMPTVRVKAVEPELDRLEVESELGWARLPGRSDRAAERRAVELVTPVLREQGAAHLADALQPVINSARALGRLLVPPLQAAGMDMPVLRVMYGRRAFIVRAAGPLVGT